MNDRISRYEMLMGIAAVVGERSTCERSHVGAIVAIDGRPLVSGYNGAPTGMPHCEHICNCMRDAVMREGQHVAWIHEEFCATKQPCKIAVHAEANAIAFAAKHGVRLDGSSLVTTLEPCLACSMLIINAGIVEVVFAVAYRDHDGTSLLRSAGIKLWMQLLQ